jgi:GNAT superfamily N-acetyltransferase
MAFSTAFQRNAFQNDAFQIRTDPIVDAIVIGGAIVAHRSGTPFSKKRYRAIVDEIAAKVEAGRLARERDAAHAADAARQAEEKAKAERKAACDAAGLAAAERMRQRAAGTRDLSQALQLAQLRGVAARSAQVERDAQRRQEEAAIEQLLRAEEENMRRLHQRGQAIIRRLLTSPDPSRGQA